MWSSLVWELHWQRVDIPSHGLWDSCAYVFRLPSRHHHQRVSHTHVYLCMWLCVYIYLYSRTPRANFTAYQHTITSMSMDQLRGIWLTVSTDKIITVRVGVWFGKGSFILWTWLLKWLFMYCSCGIWNPCSPEASPPFHSLLLSGMLLLSGLFSLLFCNFCTNKICCLLCWC